MLFSVVIPTYNRRDMVVETLNSVFAQEQQDFEVIVVDDGSTDGTLDVLAGYGDRIRVLQQQHGGCAGARNLGAREASGEYLAFLDDDDLWFPWTLAVFTQAIEAGGRPAYVAGKLNAFDDPAELAGVERTEPDIRTADDLLQGSIQEHFFMGVAHGVVRRDQYLAVGGCTERNVNGTDSDVLMKLGTAPGFALIHQPATLGYRRHGGSVTVNQQKALAGVRMLLEHEKTGVYPGGPERKRERMACILGRTRGVSARALKFRDAGVAWQIYSATFGWNLRLGRLRYLAALPPWMLRVWLANAITGGKK